MGSRPHISLAEVFTPAPAPPTPLGRHRILSSTAGIKVSPLCLGAMNLGTAWSAFMDAVDKKKAFELLDYFYESGGNFIDTSNNYQNEESENFIGEWMEARHNRDQMVIATKFTTHFRGGSKDADGANPDHFQPSSFLGNNSKSLHTSLRASLKKLRTDYIDVLYVHWWDFSTSIEELMQSLNRAVQSGKVLYLGISDTPAWIVCKANQYARDHGLAQFVVYQGQWNALLRDMERDILPMCRDEGMAIAPWGALGGGKFKTAEQRESSEGRRLGVPTEAEVAMSGVLEKIAKKHNTIITSVALAYVMHAAPNVYPIVGGRKVEHFKGNIEALKLRLDDEDMKMIVEASGWQAGFPQSFLTPMASNLSNVTTADVMLHNSAMAIDTVKPAQPAFTPTN